MSSAALGEGSSIVNCTDGIIGSPCAFNPAPYMWEWNTPFVSSSALCSTNVLINGIGAVRVGDIMAAHPDGLPCTPTPIPHSPALSTGSATVFINGLPAGRVGDLYDTGTPFVHTIVSGSPDVFIG